MAAIRHSLAALNSKITNNPMEEFFGTKLAAMQKWHQYPDSNQ
jgi:hypothetical protein